MNLIRSKIVAAASPLVLAVVLCPPAVVFGQDQSTPTPSTAPDNSAKNKHHKMTADQQTNAAGDRDLTEQIRKSIIADKSLSLYAHNVKIITINGMVTLKGPVKSDAEKQTVANLAVKAAGGQEKVTNNITVKQ
jgi:hyperosmotically inducible periplasmic protein